MANTTRGVPVNVEDEETLRRGPWTVEEDMSLIRCISAQGEGRWNSVAKCAGLKRTGKSCRLRWLNYLRPDVKRGNITPEEQFLILDLHRRWGNRWSKIAQQLPGRTDNEIKNYWRTRIKKHILSFESCDVNISKRFDNSVLSLFQRGHSASQTPAPTSSDVRSHQAVSDYKRIPFPSEEYSGPRYDSFGSTTAIPAPAVSFPMKEVTPRSTDNPEITSTSIGRQERHAMISNSHDRSVEYSDDCPAVSRSPCVPQNGTPSLIPHPMSSSDVEAEGPAVISLIPGVISQFQPGLEKGGAPAAFGTDNSEVVQASSYNNAISDIEIAWPSELDGLWNCAEEMWYASTSRTTMGQGFYS